MLWPELDDLRKLAIEVKKKTAAHFLNCLINLRCVLFQDLAYMKIKGDDHWLFGEYPFNTDQFASYVEDAKKNYENAQNQDAMNENAIDLEGINELIQLQHHNLIDKMDKLFRKRIDEIANDVNSKFDKIQSKVNQLFEKASLGYDFINYMSSFQPQHMNISPDSTPQNTDNNVNTLENDNPLETIQISRNTDDNVPFYCSTNSFGEVPVCPQNFESLQSVIDYYERLLDTSYIQNKSTNKRKVDELFRLSIIGNDDKHKKKLPTFINMLK